MNVSASPQIVIFGRDKCGDCDNAKAVFTEEGVVFQYRDVRMEPEAQARMESICRGLGIEPRVPVIVIHDFSEDHDSHIVFVEPRESGLAALRGALQPYKSSASPEMG